MEMKRRIDWTKMPTDVICRNDDYDYFYHVGGGMFSDLPLRHSKNPVLVTPLPKGILLAADQPIISWFGGECPVPDGIRVKAWFRNGASILGDGDFLGCLFYWEHKGKKYDIIAYQIAGLDEGWTV